MKYPALLPILFALAACTPDNGFKTPLSEAPLPGDGKADSVQAHRLSYGETTTATLNEVRWFDFVGEAGDVVSALATAWPRDGEVDPLLWLFDPDGSLAAMADDIDWPRRPDAHLTDFALDKAGRWLLAVSAAPEAGGPARVRLACTGGACAPEFRGAATCDLSPLGRAVVDAVAGANPAHSTVAIDELLTYANTAGPAQLRSPAIFSSAADLIATARREVAMQTFIYVPSDPFHDLHDGLLRLESRLHAEGRHGDPVVVRVLIDAHATQSRIYAVDGLFEGLLPLQLDPDLVRFELALHEHWGLASIHSKTLIVDGHTAQVTGANFQLPSRYDDPWHDAAVLLRGEIAKVLLKDFDTGWSTATRWTCRPAERPLWPGAADCDTWPTGGRPEHAPEVLDPPEPDACVPMMLVGRTPRGQPNNDNDNPQNAAFVASLASAERVVRIQSPNLNDDVALAAIEEAVQRGVQVHVMLGLGFNDQTESLPFQGGTNVDVVAGLYERLGRSTLDVRWYSPDGNTVIDGTGPGASHLKYFSVDDRLAIVGSGNWDTQSWNHSGEVNVMVDDIATVAAWDDAIWHPFWFLAHPAE